MRPGELIDATKLAFHERLGLVWTKEGRIGVTPQGMPVLDLDYVEDSEAETDANFVMTGSGGIVEIQGTAEGAPFSEEELHALLALAKPGIAQLVELQKLAIL